LRRHEQELAMPRYLTLMKPQQHQVHLGLGAILVVLMAGSHKAQPTQKTQPEGKDCHGDPAEPVEIPVPRREDVLRDLKKVARPKRQSSK
jgi:hypothetical protein